MRALWRLVVNIARFGWRIINFIREFILNILLLVIVFAALGIWGMLYHSDNPPAQTLREQALTLDLDGVVVDKPSQSSRLSKLIGQKLLGARQSTPQQNSVFDIVDTIRAAATDKNITGMVLDLQNFAGGDQPSLQYIGKALNEFKSHHKAIYAWGNNYTQAQYYLASFATQISLAPQGAVDLHGMATNNLYFKNLLDKLEVSSHIFRVGTYKSAVEPFLRQDMSPAARDADSRWITQLWNNYLTTIASNRHLQPEHVFPGASSIITELRSVQGNTAQYALSRKLVDKLLTATQMEQQLTKQFGWDKQNNDYRHISIYDYQIPPSKDNSQQANIAVITASGAIIDGQESEGAVGSDTISAQIRAARLNPAIKAIILRVNSPGGSVTASEQIREELMAAREADKPVVVSMGGLAASGGYWISTPADYIIASPSTLTGSIGIFGVVNTVENSLKQLGVNTDGVSTSPLAETTMTKALPDEVSQMMQLSIENGYHNFLTIVANSRHKTPEEVDKIAQGHVWTGTDAKQNGLVDELGDFDSAVVKAKQLAKLSDAELIWSESGFSWWDMVLGQFSASINSGLPSQIKTWIPSLLIEVLTQVAQQPGLANQARDPQNRYAWCVNCGVIN